MRVFDPNPLKEPPRNAFPKVRRQIERILEAIGENYDDTAEIRVIPGQIHVFRYKKDENGQKYADVAGNAAVEMISHRIDTWTFIGDERDV